MVNYCGQSGGKDSQAVGLWLIHESGLEPSTLRFTFCDTKNESPLTYEHIRMLSERFMSWGAPGIITLQPERGFVELAKWKRRFPSRKARFCTQHLKVIPTRNDVASLLRSGNDVTLYSGVRRAEANGNPSNPRATVPERGFDDGFGCEVIRPLLHWTTQQVLDYSKRFGVPVNPLYSYGARRVGCFPCINSCKSEIAAIAKHFPERIAEIREQERSIGKISTFFARKTVPERFRSLEVQTRKGLMKVATIDDVVEWSQTGKRALRKNETSGDLFPILENDEGLSCPSGMGMCE